MPIGSTRYEGRWAADHVLPQLAGRPRPALRPAVLHASDRLTLERLPGALHEPKAQLRREIALQGLLPLPAVLWQDTTGQQFRPLLGRQRSSP